MDPVEEGEGEGGAIEAVAVAAAAGAAALCLSCGVKTFGPWCHSCGQKNDDLRRSTFRLARDWVEDTFAFDSRMWRTLALMVAKPGHVPTSYAHGRRSRFTPPVRLFLVVSFLFFLVLSLTSTLFVAVELKPNAAAQGGAPMIAASVGEGESECDFTASVAFFVRPQDVEIDRALWRSCQATLEAAARAELEEADTVVMAGEDGAVLQDEAAREEAMGLVSRIIDGVSIAVEDPQSFNQEVNTWLPRVMFLMTPVLAILLALFIRGRDALVFDHMVLSLYTHAIGFAIVGAAILAAQAGFGFAFPAAMLLIGLYFTMALRRAYGRGWIKTVWTSAMTGLIYLITLSSIVMSIVVSAVLKDVV